MKKKTAVVPTLSDLLAGIKCHPWIRSCPHCGKDCSRVALTALVYAYSACKCSAAPYPHLVETVYHRECFLKANHRGAR